MPTKKRTMAHEGAPDDPEWTDDVHVCRCYVPSTDAFCALAGPKRPTTTYHATLSHGHDRPASGYPRVIEGFKNPETMSVMPHHDNHGGIDGQSMVREWQSGATYDGLDNLEWHHTGSPDPKPCSQPHGNNSALHDNQVPPPYDGQKLWMGNNFFNGQWNPSPSQGRVEDQPTLHLCTTCYGQPPPSRHWLWESAKSVPRQFSKRRKGCVTMPVESPDRPNHNNLLDVTGRGVQYGLAIREPESIYLSPTSMSRVSSVQQYKRVFCHVFGCNASFRGAYAKGNLARHRRLKHGSQQGEGPREYNCEEPGCTKIYKRQDARVKHYRKHHHHLAPDPALSRGKHDLYDHAATGTPASFL